MQQGRDPALLDIDTQRLDEHRRDAAREALAGRSASYPSVEAEARGWQPR